MSTPLPPVVPSPPTDPNLEVVWIRGVAVHLHPLPSLRDIEQSMHDPRYPLVHPRPMVWWRRLVFWKG